MSMGDFFLPLQPYVHAFNAWAETVRPLARADHVSYKCVSAQEFEELRARFETESDFIYQSVISQRRIAVIRFREGIPTALGLIHYLELSDQKPDGSQVSGFDHIEIYPMNGTMEMLAEQMMVLGIPFQKIVRPHHTTYDAILLDAFKIRLENEPLVEKIKRDEMAL